MTKPKIKEKDWEKFCEDNDAVNTRAIIYLGYNRTDLECYVGETKYDFELEKEAA